MRPCLLVLLLFACCGCGRTTAEATLADVSGRVTFNGRPVMAEVSFQPAGDETRGRPSRATSADDGRFTLQYSADAEGAVVGTHDVTITIAAVGDSANPAPGMGMQQAVKTARLVRVVRPGTNHFHFALTY